MMLYPSIMDLMKKADSRYSLVIATSKRARKIAEDAQLHGDKNVDGARGLTKAAEEIAEGSILIHTPKDE